MTRSRIATALTAAPSLVLALYVARLWLTGTLGYFVNARTTWIVLLGAVAFAAVGVVGLLAALRSGGGPAHLSWRPLLFLAVGLIGLVVPAHPLSASSGQASTLGSLQLTSHVSSGTPGDQFGSWIADLGQHPDAGWWTGQHVTLVGFIARQSGLPPHSVIIGRYLVTCCVVDATLLGFPVQVTGQKIPADGAWVQVTGTFGKRYWIDPTGAHYPLIDHAHLSAVTIPSSPYLSP